MVECVRQLSKGKINLVPLSNVYNLKKCACMNWGAYIVELADTLFVLVNLWVYDLLKILDLNLNSHKKNVRSRYLLLRLVSLAFQLYMFSLRYI